MEETDENEEEVEEVEEVEEEETEEEAETEEEPKVNDVDAIEKKEDENWAVQTLFYLLQQGVCHHRCLCIHSLLNISNLPDW